MCNAAAVRTVVVVLLKDHQIASNARNCLQRFNLIESMVI